MGSTARVVFHAENLIDMAVEWSGDFCAFYFSLRSCGDFLSMLVFKKSVFFKEFISSLSCSGADSS